MQLLPLDPHGTILVAGAAADSIGDQCGGWTIDWQGDHNTNADFPGATSIYGGIQAVVEAAGGHASINLRMALSRSVRLLPSWSSARPLCRVRGRPRDAGMLPDVRHLELLKRLHAAGIPVVGVLLSGRVLWVNRETQSRRTP